MLTTDNKSRYDTVPVNILLVEDNPADVLLTAEALKEGSVSHDLNVVNNGSEAVAYVKNQGEYKDAARPDIILLDINLPKKNGFEVLAEIKGDAALRHIPVIILTTSSSKQDVFKAYDLYANCYIVKPIELDDFFRIMRSIGDFWFSTAQLP